MSQNSPCPNCLPIMAHALDMDRPRQIRFAGSENSAQCLLVPLRVDPRCVIGVPSRFGPRTEKDRGRELACSVFFEVAEVHRELMRRTEATDIMRNHFMIVVHK